MERKKVDDIVFYRDYIKPIYASKRESLVWAIGLAVLVVAIAVLFSINGWALQ